MELTLIRARFISDTQFLDIDGDGIHPHPFLLAEIVFIGDSLPQDGNTLTIGEAVFTFRDSASSPFEIQIGGNVDSTMDNTRDVINSANVVLRTSRAENRITLVVAETVPPELSTTVNAHALSVTSFNSCGAP
jgi:hypothetical protein